MPELPEVELVARFLNRLVSGRRITEATLLRDRLAPHTTPKQFAKMLSGAAINFVHRRGKHILFDLDNGNSLMTHLRMTGRFMILDKEATIPKFTHAHFELGGDDQLIFQDQRHFGFMRVAATRDISELPEILKLAPEPLLSDFTSEYLYRTLKRSKRTVKELLLDQSKVCGLGNIYAAEALFLSGIHPSKRTNTLSRQRADLLFGNIIKTLQEAIDVGSTLNADPSNSDSAYYGGEYERYWRVYEREGLACKMCESSIRRLKHGGRSSYFCPKCQTR